VFSIVQLKVTALDYGIAGLSVTQMVLLFLMMFLVPMIPYLFLFLSLREKKATAAMSLRALPILEFTTKPFREFIAWVHTHRHPELLHH
jgi:choline-glycine betaine transporter